MLERIKCGLERVKVKYYEVKGVYYKIIDRLKGRSESEPARHFCRPCLTALTSRSNFM